MNSDHVPSSLFIAFVIYAVSGLADMVAWLWQLLNFDRKIELWHDIMLRNLKGVHECIRMIPHAGTYAIPLWRQQDGSLAFEKPASIYGEDGSPPRKPPSGRTSEAESEMVPMRVGVDYTYPEAYGHAEVGYLFPVGKFVRIASGAACRIEMLSPGMKFIRASGRIATVTGVKPPVEWPDENPIPDADGNLKRRIIGTVKHTGAIVLDVIINGQTVTTTPEHRFKSATRRQYVPAKSLRIGELLVGLQNERIVVGGVSAPRKSLVELHNLEVEGHNYFVGNPPVLVHNGYGCIDLPE